MLIISTLFFIFNVILIPVGIAFHILRLINNLSCWKVWQIIKSVTIVPFVLIGAVFFNQIQLMTNLNISEVEQKSER